MNEKKSPHADAPLTGEPDRTRAKPVALIPAFRPDDRFPELVAALAGRAELGGIVIIDDGSGPDFAGIFAQAARTPGVELLRHAVNRGKGAALKTGLNEVLLRFPEAAGVVTADADHQHRVEDIARVAAALTERPEALVLGCREFSGEVPLRSRLGNRLTRGLLRWVEGLSVTDTQTGLRGVPRAFIPQLLRIPAERYEFELEMLLACRRTGRGIIEVPIATVYLSGNRASHFNPVRDSMRIYFVLFRYAIVSLLTALVDNAVFAAVFLVRPDLLAAMVGGRLVACLFNFFMNRTTVFYSRNPLSSSMIRYLGLVVFSGTIGYFLIDWAVRAGLAGAIPAKIAVESLLFVFNFAVQRVFVFPPPSGVECAGRARPPGV